MKIKIVSCSNQNAWYKQNIGEVLEVTHFIGVNQSHPFANGIIAEDCIVVDEKESDSLDNHNRD